MQLPDLPERPEALVLTVEDILQHARQGRLRVPPLQTPLRWRSKHVIELYDSIVRGFPVGVLLLFRREAPAENLHFGPVGIAGPPMADAMYVLDGQQRITALVGALDHPDRVPLTGPYAVWVDLLESEFAVHRSPPDPSWLPLNLLGDRRRLLQWARTADFGSDTEQMVARAFQLEGLLTKFQIPTYLVRGATESALRSLFGRVNNAGVPLKETEVFDTLFGSDTAPSKPLQGLSIALDDATGFGPLAEGWLLRCVKAIHGVSTDKPFDERDPATPELLERTRAALQRTLAFLQIDARIPHATVLPYRFPLIVLARLFDAFPEPGARNRTLLVRWLWRGALSGEHARSSRTEVRAYAAEIGGDVDQTVQRWLKRVPRTVSEPDPMTSWKGQAAASRLYAILQLKEEPLDPETREPPTADQLCGWLSSQDLGTLFVPVTGHEARPIADRVLWRLVPEALADAEPEILAGRFIDEEAASRMRLGDRAGFVARRADLLRAHMRECIEELAAPEENDRPSIASILHGVAL